MRDMGARAGLGGMWGGEVFVEMPKRVSVCVGDGWSRNRLVLIKLKKNLDMLN